MNAKWSVMQAYAPCFAASFAFLTMFDVENGDLTSMRSAPTLRSGFDFPVSPRRFLIVFSP